MIIAVLSKPVDIFSDVHCPQKILISSKTLCGWPIFFIISPTAFFFPRCFLFGFWEFLPSSIIRFLHASQKLVVVSWSFSWGVWCWDFWAMSIYHKQVRFLTFDYFIHSIMSKYSLPFSNFLQYFLNVSSSLEIVTVVNYAAYSARAKGRCISCIVRRANLESTFAFSVLYFMSRYNLFVHRCE